MVIDMELDRYFHCKKCLGDGKAPSGVMEFGVKGSELIAICYRCKEVVWKTAIPEDYPLQSDTPCECCKESE